MFIYALPVFIHNRMYSPMLWRVQTVYTLYIQNYIILDQGSDKSFCSVALFNSLTIDLKYTSNFILFKIIDYEAPLIGLAAISLVFALAIPIIGLAVCGCRLTGKCGGNLERNKHLDIRPTKKRKRYAVCIDSVLFIPHVSSFSLDVWYEKFVVPNFFHTSMILSFFVLDNIITKENKNHTDLKIWNQYNMHANLKDQGIYYKLEKSSTLFTKKIKRYDYQ